MDRRGFTLVEMMVVLVVLGILAAIVIPNYMRLLGRAREAAVKTNMHQIQIGAEDFSVLSSGRYADNAADTADNGLTLEQLLPGSRYPTNPFTNAATVVIWDADPTAGNRGEVGFNPAAPDSYRLKGIGLDGALLPQSLTTGN